MRINRNMRCIEMLYPYIQQENESEINRNMRCIEIGVLVLLHEATKINRNMRCIEMPLPFAGI